MRTDLYTKIVLTVIAVALVAIVFQNTKYVNEARADKTNFNHFSSIPINDDGSINVKLESDMDVNIRSVGGSNVYGTLPINLKEISGNSFYGTLPVNVKEISGSSINSSNGMPINIQAVNGVSVYSSVPVKEIK